MLTKREYFQSPVTVQTPPTGNDLLQRDLGAFLVNLRKTMDRPLLNSTYKQSEIDFSIQNLSILFRFVFNTRSGVNMCWEEPFKVDNKMDTER